MFTVVHISCNCNCNCISKVVFSLSNLCNMSDNEIADRLWRLYQLKLKWFAQTKWQPTICDITNNYRDSNFWAATSIRINIISDNRFYISWKGPDSYKDHTHQCDTLEECLRVLPENVKCQLRWIGCIATFDVFNENLEPEAESFQKAYNCWGETANCELQYLMAVIVSLQNKIIDLEHAPSGSEYLKAKHDFENRAALHEEIESDTSIESLY